MASGASAAAAIVKKSIYLWELKAGAVVAVVS